MLQNAFLKNAALEPPPARLRRAITYLAEIGRSPLLARRGVCAEGADGVVVQTQIFRSRTTTPSARFARVHPSWPGGAMGTRQPSVLLPCLPLTIRARTLSLC